MKTFACYIGSNNETGELETEKITEIVARFYDVATIQDNLLGVEKRTAKNQLACLLLVAKTS